jgi:hypothetical protein
MNRLVTRYVVLTCVLIVSIAGQAAAQATRTWVSGVGDDANPCSRTAPCKTFAGAISKTAAAGEINVLDPGGFGAVTITKSISIIAEGVEAGVLVSGTNAIIVNAGATDNVVLRGLDIEGLGTGLRGIRFLAGGSLHVENCTINNFQGSGAGVALSFEPAAASQLFVKDTVIRNNRLGGTGGAILIKPGATGSAIAVIDNVTANRNTYGLRVENGSKVTVSNSVFSFSSANGIAAISTGGQIDILLDHTRITNSGAAGILSNGANSRVRITNVTVTGNVNGLQSASGGQIVSFGTNNVNGNTTDGAPTSTPGQI